MPLASEHRSKLDSIVAQMEANGESPEYIQGVVDDFKGKYEGAPDRVSMPEGRMHKFYEPTAEENFTPSKPTQEAMVDWGIPLGMTLATGGLATSGVVGKIGQALATPLGMGTATAAEEKLRGASLPQAAMTGVLAGTGLKYAPAAAAGVAEKVLPFVPMKPAYRALIQHALKRGAIEAVEEAPAVAKVAPKAVEAVKQAEKAVAEGPWQGPIKKWGMTAAEEAERNARIDAALARQAEEVAQNAPRIPAKAPVAHSEAPKSVRTGKTTSKTSSALKEATKSPSRRIQENSGISPEDVTAFVQKQMGDPAKGGAGQSAGQTADALYRLLATTEGMTPYRAKQIVTMVVQATPELLKVQ